MNCSAARCRKTDAFAGCPEQPFGKNKSYSNIYAWKEWFCQSENAKGIVCTHKMEQYVVLSTQWVRRPCWCFPTNQINQWNTWLINSDVSSSHSIFVWNFSMMNYFSSEILFVAIFFVLPEDVSWPLHATNFYLDEGNELRRMTTSIICDGLFPGQTMLIPFKLLCKVVCLLANADGNSCRALYEFYHFYQIVTAFYSMLLE